jgi:glutathione S-transferase
VKNTKKSIQIKYDNLKFYNLQGVPALVVNDVILIESMAISEYLEECYPETKLLP